MMKGEKYLKRSKKNNRDQTAPKPNINLNPSPVDGLEGRMM